MSDPPLSDIYFKDKMALDLAIFDLATVKSEERYSLRTVISLNVF